MVFLAFLFQLLLKSCQMDISVKGITNRSENNDPNIK